MAVGGGTGVAVGGTGVAVGTGVGVAVGTGVGVAVGTGVAVGIGVGVAVGDDVAGGSADRTAPEPASVAAPVPTSGLPGVGVGVEERALTELAGSGTVEPPENGLMPVSTSTRDTPTPMSATDERPTHTFEGALLPANAGDG